VQTYLERVGVVRDVSVVGAKDDVVLFSIAINGSKQKLINSISLNSVLQVTNPPPVAVLPPVSDTEASAPSDGETPAVIAQPVVSTPEPAADEYFKYNGVQ
jgi:hypothetical protein